LSNNNISDSSGQVELSLDGKHLEDRNFHLGGRSFYFFDFDDNIVHLNTKIVIFNKLNNQEIEVSTEDFAELSNDLGVKEKWKDYELRDIISNKGSFRNFRELDGLSHRSEQPLIKDMVEALTQKFIDWRGPSWDFFKHAVNNNRPISIITARGHHPNTIKRAINILVNSKDLKFNPNYLSVYSCSHPETRKLLNDPEYKLEISELKKKAIHAAVMDAFWVYETNPAHRFGMSDDDPKNVELIREAMVELKQRYPKNSFFVINTHARELIKEEVLLDGEKRNSTLLSSENQVGLFPDD